MDDFSGYNQIEIVPKHQHKTTFIFPLGTFSYRKLPFELKNDGATFQWAMSYIFHDIKHIVQPYLDGVPTRFQKRMDHLDHFRQTFPPLQTLQHPGQPTQVHIYCRRWSPFRIHRIKK